MSREGADKVQPDRKVVDISFCRNAEMYGTGPSCACVIAVLYCRKRNRHLPFSSSYKQLPAVFRKSNGKEAKKQTPFKRQNYGKI